MARNRKAPPGYIRLRTRLISVSYLITLSLGLCAFVVLYATTLHPVVVRRWYSIQELPEFKLDSPYLAEYTGNARLVLSDGTLLYEGMVDAAAANGKGRLYENGLLIYEGEFENNQFSGQGKLFNNEGLIYDGSFVSNELSGAGKFYRNGVLVYEGSFSSGQYNGMGIEYDEHGGVVYSGGFADGLREGNGTRYDAGKIVYIGGFSAGQYSGQGKLYGTDGRLLYDGEFLLGQYDGNGKLYKGGVTEYEGEFTAGKYNGTGTEYNTETGHPVFSGKYSDGTRMIAGILYDENGEPIVSDERPLPRPDPISLLGRGYSEVLTYLTQAEIGITEQTAGDTHFVIDDEVGVMYGFTLDENGVGDYLSRVYYYGLLSDGGIVVGADISDIQRVSSGQVGMDASELLVLGYSNALWGRDATAAKSRGMVFDEDDRTITAFYLPPEPPAEQDADTAEGEESNSESVSTAVVTPTVLSGRILFLRIAYAGDKSKG